MSRRTVVLTVTALATAAALAVVLWGQLWLAGQRQADDRETQVAQTAAETVALMLSYDYRSLPATIAANKKLLTGDARKQYEELEKPLQATAPKIHAITKAEVKATAVLDSTQNSAQVLLFVDQLASSTKVTQPQLEQSRIVVTLTRSGGRWLVSTLTAI